MSTPSDSAPTSEEGSAARIASILSNAEREVAQIVADVERRAASQYDARSAGMEDERRRLDQQTAELRERDAEIEARAADLDGRLDAFDRRAGELDRRLNELSELTDTLVDATGGIHENGRRLAALRPLSSTTAPVARPANKRTAGDATSEQPPHRPAEPVPGDAPAPPLRAVRRMPDLDVDGDVAGPRSVPAPEDSSARTDDLPLVAGSEVAQPEDPPERLDSARLVALSMAAEGRTREEVEAHVRDHLGIRDHAALIDYVFGGSTPSTVVPSWPPRRRRRS